MPLPSRLIFRQNSSILIQDKNHYSPLYPADRTKDRNRSSPAPAPIAPDRKRVKPAPPRLPRGAIAPPLGQLTAPRPAVFSASPNQI